MNLKCKKCKKEFVSEALDRIEFPICAECLLIYRQWLFRQFTDEVVNEDDLLFKRKWLGE